MTRKSNHEESRPTRSSRGFSTAERRRGASDILRRAEWLNWPLFRWTGAGIRQDWPRESDYRPAIEVISAALSERSPGLYAVQLEYGSGLNPALSASAEVTPRLVATTLAGIQAAKRYPLEFPRRVGNLKAWRSLAEERLQAVSKVIEGASHEISESKAILPAACAREGVESALDEYVWANGKATMNLGPLLVLLIQEFSLLESGSFHTERGGPRFGQWRALLAGLIGRACAFCPPDLVFRQAIGWLTACKEADCCRKGEDVYAMVASSFGAWFEMTRWQTPNMERLLEALPGLVSRMPPDLNSFDWFRTWHGFVLDCRAVGSLGGLDAPQVQKLLHRDLLQTATRLTETKPKRLKLLASLDDTWLELSRRMNRMGVWSELFSLGDDRLIRRLIDRLNQENGNDNVLREKSLTLFADVVTVISGYLGPIKERESALLKHLWLYDEFAKCRWSSRTFWNRAEQTLELVGVRSGTADEASLRSMAKCFLDDPFDYEVERGHLEVCSQLAQADYEKFLRIVRASSVPNENHPADAADGWAFLRRQAPVRTFLIACADHIDLMPRIWRLLFRSALALRLQLADEVAEAIRTWANPPAAPLPDLPPLPAAILSQIATLAAYRRLADDQEVLPASIREILNRPDRRRKELEALRRMRDAGQLPDAARPRLHLLEDEASASQAHSPAEWLTKAYEKELDRSKLRALQVVMGAVIHLHWSRIGLPHTRDLAAPEWDNALQIYLSLRRNRQPLKKLLRAEASGTREWIGSHPANAAFLDEMRAAGLDIDRWLVGIRSTAIVDGTRLEIYTETEPLRALEMGSLFSTCLGVGGVNAFAAVANAIELNKRVLYLKMERGAVIGRRLIGLSRSIEGMGGKPVLVAFRSYGSCNPSEWSPEVRSSPWVKILFDLHCSRLARDVGAEVSSDATILQEASNSLPMFLKWYNDGPEAMDWWVTSPLMRPLVLDGHRDQVATLLRPWFECGLFEDLEESGSIESLLRAVLWLGDEAEPLLQCLTSASLRLTYLRFLERWSQSPSVRELLAEKV